MPTRKRDLALEESTGYYRPRIGYFGTGKEKKQVRFNLGENKKEAEDRYRRIQDLYEDCCRLEKDAPGEWDKLAYQFAKQLEAGNKTVSLLPDIWKPEKSFDEWLGRTPQPLRYECLEYAQFVEFVRKAYPSVVFIASDPERHERSFSRNQSLLNDELKRIIEAARAASIPLPKGQLPTALIAGNLHEALNAYAESIRRDGLRLVSGTLKPSQRKRLDLVERLKRIHADIPLYALTFDKCKEMVAVWTNRPLTQKGTPSSLKDAQNTLAQLRRFFGWLDLTDQYQWSMPKGVAALSYKVKKLGGDQVSSPVSVETYSPAQLAIINQHAKPFERLCLYLGLNCGMGAGELGRLKVDDFAFSAPHPRAERLGFVSTEADHFLTQLRPKTGVFGQWLLWPEVAQMARWGVERATEIGSRMVFVRESGHMLYDEELQNQQAGFANLWSRLLDRVRKSHKDFPRLPFGSLRDTLPDMLRQEYSDELASLCLAHGSPSKGDSLLECYANKPFGRFFMALRALRDYYAPVFAAVTDPLDAAKIYMPVERKDRVRTLLVEGKGVAEVVRACSVSRATVYRERAWVERQSRIAPCVQPETPQIEEARGG